ncbi:MAG: hypothetical protein ACOC9S_03970, partial [Planctomycetota bacterium]
MQPRRTASAFSLVELLLAIALVALLLLSVGAALQASFNSYRENDKIAAVTQAARSALGRMTLEIRNAEALNTDSTSVTILPPTGGDWPDQIQYELSEGTLYYRQTTDGTQSEHVLLGGSEGVSITSFELDHQMGVDSEGTSCVKTVTIKLQLNVDGQSHT